jgi:hypothetical protein
LSLLAKKNQELEAKKLSNTIQNSLNKGLKHANQVVTHDYLVIFILSIMNLLRILLDYEKGTM